MLAYVACPGKEAVEWMSLFWRFIYIMRPRPTNCSIMSSETVANRLAQIWSSAVAVAATATCTSGTHRESVFPPHDRQHSDGKTSLRHVQGLRRTA